MHKPARELGRIFGGRRLRGSLSRFRKAQAGPAALQCPGIEAMSGLLAFYFGADEETSSLTNVSLWTSVQAAKQLDTFQPMLDLGKPFAAKGATFERPIMNYTTLWQLQGSAAASGGSRTGAAAG